MYNFLPISKPTITELESRYINEAVSSGWISSLGEFIEKFEKEFARYCGTDHAIAVANGTVALHLALETLGIGEKDEIIIPDFTFVATANAVKYTGAKVIPSDIEDNSLCLDADYLKNKITKNTKAIIPVHIYGHPANMNEINKIAKDYGLIVVEDAAEAHGAEINGQKVGSFGTCGIFSFYGNKIITTGEGGMITTNDHALAEKIRYLRDHAMSRTKRYWHTQIGYNYRITNIQAALGVAQLERIESIIEKKILIYKWYQSFLSGLSGIRINWTAPWAKNVYWMICLENKKWDYEARDKFMTDLKFNNIDSRPYFYPISDLPMYSKTDTIISHKKSMTGINLPSYFDLEYEDVKYICQTIISLLNGAG